MSEENEDTLDNAESGTSETSSNASDSISEFQEDDPEALKAKISALEKENKTWDKRYRDVQSLSQKTKNQIDKLTESLEQSGLTFDDGKIVRKAVEPTGEPVNYSKEKFNEKAKDDPAEAIQQLVKAEISKTIHEEKSKASQNALRDAQMADKNAVLSIPGAEDIKDKLFEIIREQGLEFARKPFSTALLHLGDNALIDALKAGAGTTRENSAADKRAATVARNGKTPTTGLESLSYDQLSKIPFDKLQKAVKEHTLRQTGTDALRHY